MSLSSLSTNGIDIPTYPARTGEIGIAVTDYPVGDVRRYGAQLNGVFDCTPAARNAVQSMINLGGGPVRFPFGNALITGAMPTIGTLPGGVWIEGDDKGGSLITFNPTAPGTPLFNFDSGGSGKLVWRSGARNLKISSSNRVAKIGIRALETREFSLDSVEIDFQHNDGSEGLQLYGRDDMTVRDVVVYAPIPLHVKKNPYRGQQVGLDHAGFIGLTLYQVCGSGHPLITVDAGCHLSNVAFTGRTTFVGGDGCFLYDSTTDSRGGISGLSFENLRWEYGGQTQTRPAFTIKPYSIGIARAVSFRQFNIGVVRGSGAGIGVEVRNVKGISLIDGQFNGASGLVALDIDGSNDDLSWQDVMTPGGMTHRIVGMTQLVGAGFVTGGAPEPEKIAYWRNAKHAGADLYYAIGGDRFAPVIKVSIPAGATHTLPVNSGSLGYAIINVQTTKGTGSIERGQWEITPDTADLSSDLDYGSRSVSGAAGSIPPGRIVVYRSIGDDAIKVKNGLAETRTFVIRFRMVK